MGSEPLFPQATGRGLQSTMGKEVEDRGPKQLLVRAWPGGAPFCRSHHVLPLLMALSRVAGQGALGLSPDFVADCVILASLLFSLAVGASPHREK